jgi:hypothetical protein
MPRIKTDERFFVAHDTHQVSRLRKRRKKRANILKTECGKFFERPSNHILQMHYEISGDI